MLIATIATIWTQTLYLFSSTPSPTSIHPLTPSLTNNAFKNQPPPPQWNFLTQQRQQWIKVKNMRIRIIWFKIEWAFWNKLSDLWFPYHFGFKKIEPLSKLCSDYGTTSWNGNKYLNVNSPTFYSDIQTSQILHGQNHPNRHSGLYAADKQN